jgi:glycosyltransferase involved in cell wall biosynthesis
MLVGARRLITFFSENRPSLIVTKGMFAHFYGGLAARWLGLPCIWHLQDFISERFWSLYPWVFGHAAHRLPSGIIVDGGPILRQLPCDIRERVVMIHNAVDTTVFRPQIDGGQVRRELGIPQDGLVIGHAARMTPWKGQHHLLEAFAEIVPRFSDAYLLFVGDPVLESDSYQVHLRNRAVALGLTNRVVFAGYRHDFPRVLATIDIFAYSSTEKDTSPLALLSAMAMGLPIVAFDIEGVREVVGDGVGGLLVPLAHVKPFAQALAQLLGDSETRQRLSAEARHRATTHFSLDRYLQQMEAFFLKCLKSHG